MNTTKFFNVTYSKDNFRSGEWNEWMWILPMYIAIFVLCVTGNVFVISTLACNKKMRTVTNIYLVNLAISDLLLGVFCMPFTIIGQIYRRFLFGSTLCKLISFAQALSVFVDIWTLVAISLERYYAICRPLKSRKWQTLSHAYKMIVIIWMVSIAFCSPIIFVSTLLKMRENAYKCREVWPSPTLERLFTLGLDVELLIVPFFVLVFANSLIVRKLWHGMQSEILLDLEMEHLMKNLSSKGEELPPPKTISPECCRKIPSEPESSNKQRPPESYLNMGLNQDFIRVVRSTHTSKSIATKKKVIRMLCFIMLEFFVCWTPLHVMNTLFLFYPKEFYNYISQKGVLGLQLLAFCSSCTNPIVYCFMNPSFRQAFLDLLKKCRIFRKCTAVKTDGNPVTPLPSSREMVMAGCNQGTHTGRSDYLEGPTKEDYV